MTAKPVQVCASKNSLITLNFGLKQKKILHNLTMAKGEAVYEKMIVPLRNNKTKTKAIFVQEVLTHFT